jgi:RHS repeat-associated protein
MMHSAVCITTVCFPPSGFTGKERDSESGLDNFGFRYYGSSMGRFSSPDDPFVGWDQSDPQTLNLYGYVRNNPLGAVDDDGHDPNPAGTCGFLCQLVNWLLGTGGGHEEVSSHIVSPNPDITSPAMNQMLNQRVPGMINLTVADLNREGNKSMAEGIKASSELTLQFGLMFIFPEADIEEVVVSSERMASPQITAGARAIAKKLGHALAEGAKSAFEGNPAAQERAAALIRNIMGNPAKVVNLGKYTDVYNAAGQGVRIENGTNKFITFLEGAKAKP